MERFLQIMRKNHCLFDIQDDSLKKHSFRVGKLSYELAKNIGLSQQEIKNIITSGLFHDIGKIRVSEKILNKPTKLTREEFEVVKAHSTHSYLILKKQGFEEPICKIAKHHHENFNGSGYPNGLKETEIPLGSRIIRITDMFDALTSDRAYREKLTTKEALVTMEDQKKNFDPFLYTVFKEVIESKKYSFREVTNI